MDKLARIRPAVEGPRRGLYSRTALCGALGLSLLPTVAMGLPEGGFSEVSSGGLAPTITLGHDTSIKLNAQRTVINWTTFNVTPDESVNFSFGAKNWIVLNRIVGLQPSKIEGVITGKVGSEFGGNIWFVSQNSIIFGRTAQVDAGGLLVAIGTPDTGAFLDPSKTLFSFNGGDALPDSRLMVLSGGRINGHGGLVAFAGPSIVTRANATVTADDGGSVLYGAAKTFQIRLAPGAGGGFDLVDFIVPDITGGTDDSVAADLAGDTRGSSVFVAAVSKSAIGSAVINLEGMITATGASTDGGDIVLSGGGSVLNRAPGASISGAAPTDIYLNKATASRDLQIRNVGHIYARPWVRPPAEAEDPPTLAEDAAGSCDALVDDCSDNGFGNGNGNGNGFGNGNGNGNGSLCVPSNSCFGPLEVDLGGILSTLFDPTAISSISVGRDARIAATASIELGQLIANRDISVSGPSVEANSLVAAGGLSVTATEGDIALASVGVVKDGSIGSTHGDVRIDAISAPQRLTVTAGRDIVLGDGTSAVSGVITLKAAQNVTLDLASAKLDTVTAGDTANLRGGALDIGSVAAPHLLARAQSVRIGTATSSGDVYVVGTNGDAIVGQATAGDDVFVLATHGTASLGSATLTGAGSDGVSVEFPGNPDAAGNGRVVRVESIDLDARLGLGTGSVTGSTSVSVRAGRDAIVDVTRDLPGGFSLIASRDATLKAPSARLDAVSAGRDLTFATTAGDLTLSTTLVATRNISISAGGALRVADVRADSGSVLLSGATVTAGAVSASEDLTLRATSGGVTTTSFRAGRDLNVAGASLNLGSSIGPVVRDLSITSIGNFTSSTPLSAGRNVTLDVAGTATLGQVSAAGTLRILANDLQLGGVAQAANAQIESRTGALRVGGAAGTGPGMVLDGTEFGQLRVAGNLRLYAGSTTGGARGDLTLQDLSTITANTPNVTFLVGNANNALVQGVLAPSVSGGVLRIGGDAADPTWRPDSILITGGLGAATVSGGANYSNIRAYDEVRLSARTNILMGSQRFITLIQATAVPDIELAAGRPAGVAPTGDEVNKVFVAAGKLEVSSLNKVVQQNTAPSGATAPVGLFFTGKFNPNLIIDPPQIVELWGALAGPDGRVLAGSAAGGAITFTVVDASGAPTAPPAGASYRIQQLRRRHHDLLRRDRRHRRRRRIRRRGRRRIGRTRRLADQFRRPDHPRRPLELGPQRRLGELQRERVLRGGGRGRGLRGQGDHHAHRAGRHPAGEPRRDRHRPGHHRHGQRRDLAQAQATEMTVKSLLTAAAGALALATLSAPASAQTRADLIPLGASAASGAVCQAVRDYDDPVVQGAGRRAWNIRCRGWEGSLGRLYAIEKGADAGLWEAALVKRADCSDQKAAVVAGLSGVTRRACRSSGAKAAYLAYNTKKGAGFYAAEGAAQVADVLEMGLKVVSGVAKPPAASAVQTSAASAEIAADFGGNTGGLARAQAAAAADPARLRARAYVQNNEWRFEQAETDFQALVSDAEARRAPPAEMGEALLNLALNVSNNGRFAEADRLFRDADVQVDAANDPFLAAQARTYRALHLRNAGRFAEAVTAGQGALRASDQARAARGISASGPNVTTGSNGELAIGGDLSLALNSRGAGRDVLGGAKVSQADRLTVQDAQALEVVGSSQAAQGDLAAARETLNRAARLLTAAEANGALNVWLRARIEADLGQIETDSGQPAQAVARFSNAVKIMRLRHAGTAAEAGLLLDLGRAQIGAKQDEAALATYQRAFDLFQQQRGALGASADDAAPYFDLLLARIASEPAKADEYRSRFFSAAESVVSNATAQTVSKLAARVASGDSAVTGLVRALDDTRRELRATEARAANLQAQNAYVGQDRTDIEDRLKTLQSQSETLEAQLLAANPRYAQLVSSEASLADLQKTLRKDEVFVKILLLATRGYGILVSPTVAKAYAIDINRGTAAARVNALRSPFEAEDTLPPFDLAGSYAMFQKLFGPIAGEVLGAKHLIYEPDGALIALPVATFVTADPAPILARTPAGKDPDYRQVAWLGAKTDSALVLSAASFMQSRAFAPSKAKQAFLAFADPSTPARSDPQAYSSIVRRAVSIRSNRDISNVCENTRLALLQMPALPDTADEVRQVGASLGAGPGDTIVTGKAFTDDVVKARNDLSDYKVIYFATHGLLPQPSACLPEPALMTSVGVGDSDGLLNSSEILDLKLDADLVVLSACDTGGAGGEEGATGLQGGGEALGGLTRAVIYAGGRSLIVSHWSVDSVATVRLMTGMFSAGTASQDEAMLKAQATLQASEQFSHPYFWAPFTIVGDGSKPLPAAASARPADR